MWGELLESPVAVDTSNKFNTPKHQSQGINIEKVVEKKNLSAL